MSMFEDLSVNEEAPQKDIKDQLSQFSAVRPKTTLNLDEVDAVVAPHGFSSREPTTFSSSSRRRRKLPDPHANEPTRYLAIRCRLSVYEQFVRFADREQLHYNEAIEKLLSLVGNKK